MGNIKEILPALVLLTFLNFGTGAIRSQINKLSIKDAYIKYDNFTEISDLLISLLVIVKKKPCNEILSVFNFIS